MLAGGVGFGTMRDALKGTPKPGEKVVVMGGDNYRIGMGGGAVSSVETGVYANAIELNAIQRANPEMQKRVSNVVRALAESDNNPIVSIHDHGAGGHLNAAGGEFHGTMEEAQALLRSILPLYDKYKEKYHCVYQTDIYTNEQWLEIMPLDASKSNAIRQLQSMLNCEKLIVFGDGKNDIDMFQIADKSYAVANAHNDLKQYATEVILSNDEDGVARWLEANYKQ